ncbi:MAG: hypothetical protein M5R36_15570, partial [Deltaproteobacteria bacterium]|nr:hypothetical protein [Deltaproteobacteria bacterium]
PLERADAPFDEHRAKPVDYVTDRLRRSLERIIYLAQSSGARILVSTVPVNWRFPLTVSA